MTPLVLKQSLQKYTQSNLQKIVAQIVVKDKEILQVKYEELQRGVTPLGGPIGFYSDSPFWEWYADEKNQRNPLPGYGVVDLIDTGAFARGNAVISLGSGWFTIESSDFKADALIEKYGRINEAINQESWNRLQEFSYFPKLIRAIKL